jgi:hypothetical protein
MKTIRTAFSLLATVLAGSSVSVYGQENIHYKVSATFARPADDSPIRADGRFHAAEARVSGAYDPTADALLQAAEKLVKSIFNVPSLQFQRAATERVSAGPKRGDVLIAEWNIREKFAEGPIVLVDTPYYSYYYLRLANCSIRSQADLTAFLSTALIWGKAPIFAHAGPPSPQVNSPGMTVLVPASPALTYFKGDLFTGAAYPGVGDFSFEGLLEGTDWFLNLRIGKSFTRSAYPVPPWVPERFPPLADLVKFWGLAQVRGEVGNKVKPFEGGPEFTGERDKILIAELARRGLSEDEVLDLLTDVERTADGYQGRLISMIEGIRASGTDPFMSRFFTPALKAYEGIGPVAAKAVETLFGNAAVPRCPVDVEADALAVVKKGVFFEGPLNYLALCSTSPKTLAALQALNVPIEWQRQRNFAIDNVQGNIKLPKRTGKPGGGR